VVDDPEKLTTTLLEAIELAGVRALISRGWSKLGNDEAQDKIFYLDDCPHGKMMMIMTASVMLCLYDN
jgi:hypothetical protein